MSPVLRYISIFLLLLVAPVSVFATHIVGGVLNYSYNGGNIYTVTLRLFRDCGPNTASFPANITILVRGNNGANFNPSKNLTISLGSVNSVTAQLDPCSIAPNPMPCVQEGVYTKTISLPPNNGGYHLYYQLEARNLSLTNVNSSCNCIGETFYAYIPNYTVNVNGNSNAVFNSFPPLFLCVNQGFSIDHSATDANGDSLVYSLYTPYNGDNGNGPLDPTFSNNVASFTPVNYVNGYTYLNPLGPSPFTINPVTGLLTGTPGITGQFVVGVKVREYRNGVFISETLRDFQFNVLNCPAPPPQLAVGNQTINNGCSKVVTANGLAVNTTTWSSISPGAPGAYDNYLSCTNNCLTNTITSTGTPPPFVYYKVCGVETNCKNEYTCDTFRIDFKPPLSVSIAPINPALCNGQTATTITAIGSGGTPPYSFLWNNVNPSQSISVGVGTYNVKLSDVSGCPPVYASAVVTSYSVPVTINVGPDVTRCVTNPVAALTASFSGASGCVWSAGNGTFSPNNTSSSIFYTPTTAELAAGSVTLQVSTTGSGACPPDTDYVVINYTNFTGTVVATPTPVACFGQANGSATLSMNGGHAPHSYTWQVSPAQTGSVLSNLAPGTYSYIIGDNIGCTKEGSVVITQPTPLALSHTVTNATCSGLADGSATVTGIGGTAPYTYSWMPILQTGSAVTGLAAGTYTSKVTDSRGCSTSSLISITQPSSLSIAATQSNVACNGDLTGAISTTVSGGTAPYSYSWNPGGTTSPALTNLPAGTYTLRVTDQRMCQAIRIINITQPQPLAVSITATNESCHYLNNAASSASVSGGTGPYNYLWTPGNTTSSLNTNLQAGNYTVSVTDANNCTQNATVNVTEPPVLGISLINYSPVRCFSGSDGSVVAIGNGGVSPHSYSWSPTGTTSASLTGRPAGTYTVTLTDANNCTVSATQVITEPPILSQSAVINTVSCAGGNNAAVTLTASGGTVPYQFLWLPGGQTGATLSPASAGSYTAILTDANNCSVSATYSITEPQPLSVTFNTISVSCFGGNDGIVNTSVTGGHPPYSFNWSNAATTADLQGVPAGTYTVVITDILSCDITRTIHVQQPAQLEVTISFTNETCDYLDNGIAVANVTGGTAPYNYQWFPGAITTSVISSLSAGSYSVSITDANSCATSTQVTIQEPPTLVATLTSSAVSCFGGSDGMTFAQVAGGTPNYQYTFSPSGSTLSSASNLSAGIHSVTVSDSRGCLATATIQVTQPSSLTASETITNVSCFNGNDGAITSLPAGGTPPYTFLWIPGGQNSSTVNNLTIGNYSVVITDANNCSITRSYTITQPATLSITQTITTVSCNSGSDGFIIAEALGGTAPYSYDWAHGPSTATAGNLTAGIYTLTVTDNNNCIATKTIGVTQPSQLVLSVSFTNESCDYLNNGSASVSGSGAIPPYTFTWMPGNTTTTAITGLSAGSYTVHGSDANNCPAQQIFTISEPLPLAINFDLVTPVNCFGETNGAAQALVTGGTPNYTFTWSSGSISSALNTSLAVGIHTVAIADENGCTTSSTVEITEPLPLTISALITSVQCSGGNNGAISLNINGGTPSYSNVIMPGNISGTNFSNLTPGTYTIYSTDSKGCSTSATITVDQALSMSTVLSHTNPDCGLPNGVASIAVTSGGVPPFTYSWMPTGGSSSVATGLSAGSYTVVVTDLAGCSSTKFVDLSDNGGPIVGFGSITNVSCYGGSDGAISATVTGGTPPLTYSWSPSGGSAATATNLTAGYYSLLVLDALNCKGVVTSSLVSEPSQLSVVITGSAVSCNGGSDGAAQAVVAGGTPPYTYNWSSGIASGSQVSGLSMGVFSLTVTDNNLCSRTTTFQITEPAALGLAITTRSVTCFNGSNGAAAASPTGGIAPYNFTWSPGGVTTASLQNAVAGTYTVSVEDANGCPVVETVSILQPTEITLTVTARNSDCSLPNGDATVTVAGGNGGYTYSWSPSGSTNSVATMLMAESHTVTVLDINQCLATETVIVNDNPAPLLSVSNVTHVSCFGGSDGVAEAIISGGTGPFTYSWSPAGGNGAVATGLTAGLYSVTVMSANNCSVITEAPVITQPLKLVVSVTTSSVLCFGTNSGSAVATSFGGTGIHSYSWQAGVQSGNSTSGLSAGTYTVLVTDENNCSALSTFTITQPQQALTAAINSSSVLCHGGSDGSATVSITGGMQPYNTIWSPSQISSTTISGLAAGTYTADVTDINNCSTQQTVVIVEPSILLVQADFLPSNCSAPNGVATATASGGTPPYSYQWQPGGGTGSTASSLAAEIYSITVTDDHLCTSVESVTVTDLPAPEVSVNVASDVSCFGGLNGSAIAVVSGGTGPFTYSWSAGSGSSATVTGLPAGQHTVQVVSANGCTVTSVSPLVTQPSSVLISLSISTVNCFNGSNGMIQASVFGGVPAYTYSWAPVSVTTPVIQNLSAGTYSLFATDANSCTSTATASISQPSAALSLVIHSNSVACTDNSTGSATVLAAGGTPPYSFNWSPAASSASVASGLSAGLYSVHAIDFNGCDLTETVAIDEPAFALTASITITPVRCFGEASGSATITATGGTGAFTYSWSPGVSTSSVISGLSIGNYTAMVADQNLCTTVLNFSVTQPPLLTATLFPIQPSCERANGMINIQVNGGTGPYTFQWSSGGSDGASQGNLLAGTYTVQVNDAMNCTHSLSTTLTDIPGPTVTIVSSDNVNCFGLSDGSITATAAGVSPPFNFQWFPLGGSTATALSLPAGTYTVSVTDDLGCTSTATAVVNQPQQLNIGTDSLKNVSCFGLANGAIYVNPYGGTAPFSYTWSNGPNTSSVTSLNAGSYTVQVADANLCTFSLVTIITEPPLLTASATITRPIICFGGAGDASVSVNGGTAPYNVNWSANPPQTGNVMAGVSAGVYTVTITDKNNCTSTDMVHFTQPTQIITSVSRIDTVCAGSNSLLTASATGGAGDYYYNWAPDGAINSGTLQIFSATNKTFTVVAFDKNGCAGTDAVSVINVFDLSAGDLQLLGYSPICPGKVAVLEAKVGNSAGAVTYTWNNNLPSGPGPYIVQPDKKTTYSVSVSNHCGVTVSKTFTVDIATPPVAIMSADSFYTCAPGNIQFREVGAMVNSSDPVVDWTWDFGNGDYSGEQDPLYYFMDPGTYSVTLTVTSDHGCVGTSSTPIVVNVYPPPVASFTLNKTVLQLPFDDLVCTNLSTGATNFRWDFGGGITSFQKDPTVRLQIVGQSTVQLIAISEFGCMDTVIHIITSSSQLIFPNAFTPNENGPSGGTYDIGSLTNDVFFPYTSGVEDFKMQIFNRWGELIFESTDVKIGWDGYYRGVLCQQGVYVYKASAKLGDGNHFSKTGTITLLRK